MEVQKVPVVKTISMGNTEEKSKFLAAGYTQSKRNVEIICVCSTVVLTCVSLYRICNIYFLQNIWVFLCAFVLSMYIADFFSGIVHWGADTWGSLDTPVFSALIRSFREHHLRPTAICHHDVFEANGDNCAIVVPLLLLTAVIPIRERDLYFFFLHSLLTFACVWVALTNQIHKWSHTRKLPKYVEIMMDLGIIISKRSHKIHHENPFDKYYCITNGWLNPILASINFWKRLEEAVTYLTGQIPREDDMLWAGISQKVE